MGLRKYLAEFLAAFFLVFAVAGAVVADQHLAVVQVRDSFGPLGVALAHGLAFAAAIAAVARISGGYANPAVSLAFFVTGRMNAKDLMGYIASQLLGGLAAAFLIKRLFVAEAVDQAGVGAPALGEGLSIFQGIAIEIVLTFLLVLVIWGVAVDRKGPRSFAPLAIGLTLTTVTLVGAAFSGAAVNPARWFGPAVAAGQFRAWPVWIVGPAVGALLAALLYESFFLTDTQDAAGQDLDSEAGEDWAEDGDDETVADMTPDSAQADAVPVGEGPASSAEPQTAAGLEPAAATKPPEPSAEQPAPGSSAAGAPGPAEAPPSGPAEQSPPPPPRPPGPPGASTTQKTPEQTPAPGPESSPE